LAEALAEEKLASHQHSIIGVDVDSSAVEACTADNPCLRAAIDFVLEALLVLRLAGLRGEELELREQLEHIVFTWIRSLNLGYADGMAYYATLKRGDVVDAVERLGFERVREILDLVESEPCSRDSVVEAVYILLDSLNASREAIEYFAKMVGEADCSALKRAIVLLLFLPPAK
jgi:hypothetical protein